MVDNVFGREGAFPQPGWCDPPIPTHSPSRRSHQRYRILKTATNIANNLARSLNTLYISSSSEQDRANNTASGPLPHIAHINQIRQTRVNDLTHAQTEAASAILQATWQFLGRAHSDEKCNAGPRSSNPHFALSSLNQSVSSPLATTHTSHDITNTSQSQHNDTNEQTPDQQHIDTAFNDSGTHIDIGCDFDYVTQKPRVPIHADKLALPTDNNTVNMLDVLPPALALLYSDPTNILCSQPPAHTPKPTVFASHEEYLATIHRLDASDMLSYTTEPKAINGMHATTKPDGSQRLIIDARPANAQFLPPAKVRLSNPSDIASLTCDTQIEQNGCKVDQDNFFHRFRLPAAFHPYFALPAVRAADVGLSHVYGPDTMVHPCINRLPMGWSHSVLLAQAAHEHIVYSSGLLQPTDAISADNDRQLNRMRHLIYVDDLIIFGADKRAVQDLQRRYIQLMVDTGFVIKDPKVVLPTSAPIPALGHQFDGQNHQYGAKPSKLLQLISDTAAMLSKGTATGRELASLVGTWTWMALVRRPVLSVFSAVYRFQRVADRRRFVLWPSVRKELFTISGFAPLLFADIGAQYSATAIATDASALGFGVVTAPITTTQSHTCAAASGAPALPHITQPQRDAIVTATDLDWTTTISAPWKAPLTHINYGELSAANTATKWAAKQQRFRGHRLVLFSDSTTVVGALAKGRTSSFKLLSIIRKFAATCLVSNIRIVPVWLPSDCNPADRPSRSFGYHDH